jgi:hypothetical protein
MKIFINYKPKNVPYGGGNIFSINFINYLKSINNEVVYEFENDIDIFFIIDPFKGKFKKYGLGEIVEYKKNNNHKGKIVIRINDCDKTRPNVTKERSREIKILQHYKNINYFIFNSKFIQEYYMNKYNQLSDINHYTIYNGGNTKIFYPKNNYYNKEKLTIVTHHWSDNINKGYETYYKLHKYFENRTDYDFKFIGRKFNDKFKNVPINGPYKGKELAEKLRNCDIYITDSVYDSCPMHVVEGILSGLPILYTTTDGGAKHLCELPNKKIGESFNSFPDLIDKIEIISENLEFYKKNINESLELYNNDICMKNYFKIIKYINLYI